MSFRRRSSMSPHVPSASVVDSEVFLPEADPQEEARERRVRQKKRQSIVGLTPSRDEAPKKSVTLLAEHYTNCIKLSAENKINVKNAFSLQLIDYLAEKFISRKEKEGKGKGKDLDTFTAASCALDASTKIYAYRVDSIHTDALKLAGGVGSTAAKDGEGNPGTAPGDEDEDEIRPKKGSKRSKQSIEKNLKNITLSRMEMDLQVDPLFKKITSQYDSGQGNYFVNTLSELDDDGLLLWDPDAPLHNHQEDASNSKGHEPLSARPFSALPSISQAFGEKIVCPAFEGFNFRDWNLEEDDLNSSILGFSQPMTSTQKNPEDENAFDIHAPVPEDFDDFTAADAVLDAPVGEETSYPVQQQQQNKGLFFTENLRDILSSVPLEYSYFDSNRMGSFAGPKHWKFRQPVVRPEARLGGAKGGDGKKKAGAKEDAPLDFETLDKDASCRERVDKLMQKPKKAPRLQPKTIQSWSEDKRVLPDELRYNGSDFVNLYLLDIRPSSLASEKTQQQSNITSTDFGGVGGDDDIGDYDYDNAVDTENFCPADLDNSNYDDGLVSAPSKVEKINISYAKLAKKVDMKRLKHVEWDILRTEDEKENRSAEGDKPSKEDQLSNVSMSGTKSFSQLYKNLETSSKMPPKMVENLSVPLAFAALLHLCNENSLRLKGSSDLSDFLIMQG
eukprot:TRINITY_DN3091_c0_g1_i1.p1 TRINITY_DN3091_c0_g1~~TRINITY_DN3091_c0_g1_i1.p1  ORF type:complete len:674 (+),score=280.96 TRINITY_DN3091_c0_g1_i1:69-2090(+)